MHQATLQLIRRVFQRMCSAPCFSTASSKQRTPTATTTKPANGTQAWNPIALYRWSNIIRCKNSNKFYSVVQLGPGRPTSNSCNRSNSMGWWFRMVWIMAEFIDDRARMHPIFHISKSHSNSNSWSSSKLRTKSRQLSEEITATLEASHYNSPWCSRSSNCNCSNRNYWHHQMDSSRIQDYNNSSSSLWISSIQMAIRWPVGVLSVLLTAKISSHMTITAMHPIDRWAWMDCNRSKTSQTPGCAGWSLWWRKRINNLWEVPKLQSPASKAQTWHPNYSSRSMTTHHLWIVPRYTKLSHNSRKRTSKVSFSLSRTSIATQARTRSRISIITLASSIHRRCRASRGQSIACTRKETLISHPLTWEL